MSTSDQHQGQELLNPGVSLPFEMENNVLALWCHLDLLLGQRAEHLFVQV